MSIKAKDNKMAGPKSIGLGVAKDTASHNFIGGTVWMQKINRGTLVINPEFKDKSLDDILTESGLNFPVYLVPTEYKSPVSGIIYQSDSYSVIRGDNDLELGRGFSSGYSPISYPDILNQFFQGAIDLGGIPTRGISFHGGAKGAIQFAMPAEYLIQDRPHKTFLNFYSSHDGSFGVTMNEADICIVCGNTFAASKADATYKWTVKHTINMQKKIDDIRPKILQAEYNNKAYYQLLDKASTKDVSGNVLKEFLFAMFPDGEQKENGKVNAGPSNQRINLENAIANTAAESNKNDISIYDVFQGALRYTSYRTQNRTQDEQWDYAVKSPVNAMAYDWMLEQVK